MKRIIPGEDEAKEIKELFVERVDLVAKGASGKVFTLLKSEDAVVVCSNCNTTHSAEKLRGMAVLLKDSGMNLTCGCGEKIVVEIKKDEEDAAKKAAEEAAAREAEAKKKAEEEAAKGEKSETDKILESLSTLETENEKLKEKNKDLETENEKKENTITELNAKVEVLQKEKEEIEELAKEAIALADKVGD